MINGSAINNKIKIKNLTIPISIFCAWSVNIQTWHDRMCHLGKTDLLMLEELVEGVKFSNKNLNFCSSCHKGKIRGKNKGEFSSRVKSTQPLELIHLDTSGIISTPTMEGYQYYRVMVDDFTGYSWVTLNKMNTSLENTTNFKFWQTWVERKFDLKVKKVRTDGGPEFLGDFKLYCEQNDIEHEISAPYQQWQNGRSERNIGILADKTRTCLIKANLPVKFWGHAIIHTNWVKNRSPYMHAATPFERLENRKPDLKKLLTFGCPIIYATPDMSGRKKWDPKGHSGIYLGVDKTKMVYKYGILHWKN